MKITYLAHSGFLVETDTHLLLFDYYTGSVPTMDPGKPLLIFASHHHPDHYNPAVISICAAHPKVTCILSKDIHKSSTEMLPDVTFVSPDKNYKIADCRIRTLSSTDCGVAFLVHCGKNTIYHAGDLNLWLWPGMEKSQSFGMMRRYMAYTEPLRGEKIDVAFLTLDNRQGNGAFCNIDYYMRHFQIETAVPMHYFGSTELADKLIADPSSEPYRHKIRKMEEGDVLVL